MYKKLKGRALVVDDDDTNRLVIIRQLEHMGLICVGAKSSQDALSTLRTDTQFNIGIFDLRMPEEDGFELLKSIRDGEVGECLVNLPIIACTADAMKETVDHVHRVKFDGLLLKPFSSDELNEQIYSNLQLV